MQTRLDIHSDLQRFATTQTKSEHLYDPIYHTICFSSRENKFYQNIPSIYEELK